ncbi:MAG: phosphatidylethanolamine-binding protein [gamma proteobacterium symbiont of Ctena orbiculata]|nr:MAG: phosphatidylethanolamine-binding protein [gamma proteobacterium symbiont of Ctena orbiculata]PVV23798.1 MAG: phosphatidylethanolamine-binding protein [gamma proteobacterium symbiont of Ctena orbiculata]PVV26111.1 MAG: phosphatidylethanolamine-binding protein [gamma proteobacterium symbiont of Ctena orbiculata]
MPFTLISNAFSDGDGIPVEYTCQGADLSPQLAWGGVPEKTRSLVLIVDDPDAPDPMAPKMVWVHWVLYNLPPETRELTTAIKPAALPRGTGEGINDWNRTGYGGPCPPIGRHRYFHKLYALDSVLQGLDKPTKVEVELAMKGHVIGEAVLMGTYIKST